MTDDNKILDQLCSLFDEAGLAKGADQLRAAGLPENEIKTLELAIANADDPQQVMTEIADHYSERHRQAELEKFIRELPEAGREAEIRRVADRYGIPVERARAAIERDEWQSDIAARFRKFWRW